MGSSKALRSVLYTTVLSVLTTTQASLVSAEGGVGLPFANVTVSPNQDAYNCTPTTQLAGADGSFTLWCSAKCNNVNVSVSAPHYVAVEARLKSIPINISLTR